MAEREAETGEQLTCAECGQPWLGDLERWPAYRTDDPREEGPPAVEVWCPECGGRAFGGGN